jgi:hypothetical protein
MFNLPQRLGRHRFEPNAHTKCRQLQQLPHHDCMDSGAVRTSRRRAGLHQLPRFGPRHREACPARANPVGVRHMPLNERLDTGHLSPLRRFGKLSILSQRTGSIRQANRPYDGCPRLLRLPPQHAVLVARCLRSHGIGLPRRTSCCIELHAMSYHQHRTGSLAAAGGRAGVRCLPRAQLSPGAAHQVWQRQVHGGRTKELLGRLSRVFRRHAQEHRQASCGPATPGEQWPVLNGREGRFVGC